MILGLDLGVGSIGWCLIEHSISHRDVGEEGGAKIIDMGVRIFPAGSEGSERDWASGKEKSLAEPRRMARSMRRQRERRRRRLIALAHDLQRLGLFPTEPVETPVERDEFFKKLDATLRPPAVAPTVEHHTWLHRLFAAGIEGTKLTPHQLGRVLYYAAQLRGFQSNAKERGKAKQDPKNASVVYTGISKTRALRTSPDEALVATLARLNPEADGQRIRGRYTAREDRRSDVERLLAAQAVHYADVLTDATREKLLKRIFDQRPLKNNSHLVGRCALYPDEPRGELALPSLQRLRILQKVTDLEVIPPDGDRMPRPLDAVQRALVRDHLYSHESISFTQLRKLLGFPAKKPKAKADNPSLPPIQPPFHEFNLEREDSDEKLIGDRTHCALAPLLGEKWNDLDLAGRDELVATILEAEDEETAKEALIARYGVDNELAQAVVERALETDRGRFCARAARELCTRLDTSEDKPTRLATALKSLRGRTSPQERAAEEGLDFLPPYLPSHPGVEAFHDSPHALRNPSVLRVLRELRLVVNALIRKHGKPARIRIEFARELKNPPKKRQEIARRQKERESEREKARKMLVELGLRSNIVAVTPTDIEKWLLGEECAWHCPYSGTPIPPALVFGDTGAVQIEHIIPRSISFDNSFANKTLALAEWNIRKNNRTPYTAFSASPEWPEILRRVAGFVGSGARGKLARFQWDEREIEVRYGDFTSRHLQETAWAARLAKDYLAVLFGAEKTDAIDATGTRRIETISGVATGLLRQAWCFSEALLQSPQLPKLPPDSEDRPKSGAADKLRIDHRHHAIDALVVALTTPSAIAALSSALASEQDLRRVRLPLPSANFENQLREKAESIIVSHRVNRRVAGPLHKAIYYQAPRPNGRRFQRKELKDLKTGDFDYIVDARIRTAVLDAWAKRPANQNDPANLFGTPENLPRLADGTTVKRVTLPIKEVTTVALGSPETPARQLHVLTGGNFCVVIVECPSKNAKGKPHWEFRPITLLDAARAIANRSNEDRRTPLSPAQMLLGDDALKPGEKVVFTVRSSEALRLRKGPKKGIIVVGTASKDGIEGAYHHDSRGDAIRKRLGASERIRLSPTALKEADTQKVVIGPLGEIYPARD